jgi:hypothetical protein
MAASEVAALGGLHKAAKHAQFRWSYAGPLGTVKDQSPSSSVEHLHSVNRIGLGIRPSELLME